MSPFSFTYHMDIILTGLAIGAFAIIVTRKNGPWNIIAKLREAGGTSFQCSVCASFWAWLVLSPTIIVDGVTFNELIYYGGALGAAFVVLALAGALDLDR